MFLISCLSVSLKLHRDDGSVDTKWNDLIILIINTWIDIVCENGQEMENVSQLDFLVLIIFGVSSKITVSAVRINQSINQSINHLINHLINHVINHSIN